MRKSRILNKVSKREIFFIFKVDVLVGCFIEGGVRE